MRRPALLTAVALLAGLLTACGGGSSADTDTSGLPEVSGGGYGDKPKITIPEGEDPPKKLETEVLEEGDGPAVKKGDLLVADYLGATWRNGKTFDNSYDRGNPAAFTLTDGQGGVISGWVKGLAGAKAGSRVLMVVPPEDGYGTQGNPQAGIKGTDTLVFVVDVIASYNGDTGLPERTAATDLPEGIPTVSGEENPTVSVPKGTEPPKEPETTVLAEGTGDDVVKDELAIVQFTAVDWTGKALSSSWERGPQGFPIGVEGQPSPFDLLEGVPTGSRVLLQLPAPAEDDPRTDSVAVVIDVLGQHGSAKKESNG